MSRISAQSRPLHKATNMRYATLMAHQRTVTARARLRRAIDSRRHEIARIENRLQLAKRDLIRLERLLSNLEREGITNAPVASSTSARRLLVEQLVLRRLSRNIPRSTSSDELWPLAQMAGVSSRSTFRSQLRRMSQSGLIMATAPGAWRLAPDTTPIFRPDPRVDEALAELRRRDKSKEIS